MTRLEGAQRSAGMAGRFSRRVSEVARWVRAGVGAGIGSSMLIAGIGFGASDRLTSDPVEEVIEIWRDDPSLKRLPRLGIAPITGGAMLSLSGEF